MSFMNDRFRQHRRIDFREIGIGSMNLDLLHLYTGMVVGCICLFIDSIEELNSILGTEQ
jgi:hypothetical protein